jgi:hypothetical protein
MTLRVCIRRQWNDHRLVAVPPDALRGFHSRSRFGGMGAASPRPFLHARLSCDRLPRDVVLTEDGAEAVVTRGPGMATVATDLPPYDWADHCALLIDPAARRRAARPPRPHGPGDVQLPQRRPGAVGRHQPGR